MLVPRFRGSIRVVGVGFMAAVLFFPALVAAQSAAAQRPYIRRVQYGIASWYGSKSEGRLMACGEPFNEYAMVAAHRTLPLGTRVQVTNLRNGRSVVVRIRDRGPYVANRIIDLSRAAARRLGFTGRGLAPVRVRVLSVPKKPGSAGSAVANAATRPGTQPHLAQTGESQGG